MSWTKTEFWEEICAMTGDYDDYDGYEEMMDSDDETEIDMFSDRRLDFTGYEEFDW